MKTEETTAFKNFKKNVMNLITVPFSGELQEGWKALPVGSFIRLSPWDYVYKNAEEDEEFPCGKECCGIERHAYLEVPTRFAEIAYLEILECHKNGGK